jgi:catechol 2,3-dioxygenase-like lactoylglutathione lyase family enzyme
MRGILLALLATAGLAGAAGVERPKILGVAHISLFAHDYEASRAFYHDFLGFDEPFSLKKPDGSPSMTFFKVNDRQYIELSPEKEPNTDRLNHYAIETTDAEAMRRYLASQRVTVPDHVRKGRIGNLNFMIKDPEGHNIEIVQYPADGWTMREKGKHMPDARISKRMMHVGIIVTNLDSELKFYTDVLGFRETWRGSHSGKVLSWVNLRVPDGEDYVEFMLFKEPPAPDKRGTSHHLALEVPDAAASVVKLGAKPYRRKYSRAIEVRTGINRKRQVNLFDPEGTRTELMEAHTVDGTPAPSSQAPPP